MYESPIDVFYNDIVTKLEDGVLKAVRDVGITVDKEELIKALQYDRDSYRRGYKDGVNHANADWIMRWNEVLNLTPWQVDEIIGREEEE